MYKLKLISFLILSIFLSLITFTFAADLPLIPDVGSICEVDVRTGECEKIIDLIVPAESGVALLASNIGVPVSITLFAASAGAIMVTASAGSANVAFNLSQIFQSLKLIRFYLLGLVQLRRKKPWGRVMDKLTGRPIPLATVQVYGAEFNKLKDVHLTDIEGRFDALALAGKYYLVISKKGYKAVHSELINISSPTQVLNIEVSLMPNVETINLNYIRRISVLSAIKRFIQFLNPFVLIIGTLLSLVVLFVLPTALNYIVFGLYVLLDIFNFYFSMRLKKPFGTVIDVSSKDLLPLSVVRIFDDEKSWLLETKVTDQDGRFYFLLVPGKYYLTSDKNGYLPFHSDSIVLSKSGVADFDIKMKRVL